MKPLLLARFTPSLTAPEDLEAIFVQREPLAERLLKQLQESITTANKHFTLLVGPRGIGKTHIVTLVRNRLVNRADLRSLCLVAWLREEEWGVMSFLDLLLRILRSLQDSLEAEVSAERLEALHDLPLPRAEREATNLLREVIGDKTLVLLVENLDDIFRGLPSREQGAFRAFLQENACVTILATTPGLFEGVSRRQSPFFGFFRIHHLEELGFEEAAQLLHKIASRRDQGDLAAYILTPTGRARIRAIHHLAQGNPRVYVILSEFLTRQSLDELVDPVLRMLDDLTPYYQSRLAWLSTQQRKLVEFLANYRIPCSVKELARRCFISPQTASGQLRKLVEWGYLRSESEGRESFYELREPLMRFCLDLKKERKQPLRPLVEILRIWWTPDELDLQLRSLDTDVSPTAAYLVKALEACRKESNDPRTAACRRDFHTYLEANQLEEALRVAEEWVAVSKGAASLFHFGYANMMLQRWDAASEILVSASAAYPNNFYLAWLSALLLNKRGLYEEAVDLATKARGIANKEGNKSWLHSILSVQASSLLKLERYELCVISCDEALRANPDKETASIVLRLKGESLLKLARFQDLENALIETAADADHFFMLGIAQCGLGRIDEALANLDRSLAMEDSVWCRITKAKLLAEENRWQEVMPEIERSFMISPQEMREWTPVLSRIALLDMARNGGTHHNFLTVLNQRLQAHDVPVIRVRDLTALAAKDFASDNGSPQMERFSEFFQHLSARSDDAQVLMLLKAIFHYARTNDESSLRRLPLEERQLLQGLKHQVKSAA